MYLARLIYDVYTTKTTPCAAMNLMEQKYAAEFVTDCGRVEEPLDAVKGRYLRQW